MQTTEVDSVRVEFQERVRHVYSDYRTSDEELSYARTINETADTIQITTTEGEEATTEVIVSTPQAVYHFRTFRADYVGHASRTLIELLAHFKVNLPIEYVIAHKSFIIYLNGDKIVVGENKEYPIAFRSEGFELVESVEWNISAAVLDAILRWTAEYEVEPVEIVESAVRLLDEKLLAAKLQEQPTE